MILIRRINLMTEYVNNMKYRKYHIVSKSHKNNKVVETEAIKP